MFADLVVDLLVAEIGFDGETCIAQGFGDFATIIVSIRCDRGDNDLLRREQSGM